MTIREILVAQGHVRVDVQNVEDASYKQFGNEEFVGQETKTFLTGSFGYFEVDIWKCSIPIMQRSIATLQCYFVCNFFHCLFKGIDSPIIDNESISSNIEFFVVQVEVCGFVTKTGIRPSKAFPNVNAEDIFLQYILFWFPKA